MLTPRQSQRLTVGLYVVALIAVLTLAIDPPMWVYLAVLVVALPYAGRALWLLFGEMLTRHKAQF